MDRHSTSQAARPALRAAADGRNGPAGSPGPATIPFPGAPPRPFDSPAPAKLDARSARATGQNPAHPAAAVLIDAPNVLYDATAWQRWLWRFVGRMGVRTSYDEFTRVWTRDYAAGVNCGRRAHDEALACFLLGWGLSWAQIDEIEATGNVRRQQFEGGLRLLPDVARTVAVLAGARRHPGGLGRYPRILLGASPKARGWESPVTFKRCCRRSIGSARSPRLTVTGTAVRELGVPGQRLLVCWLRRPKTWLRRRRAECERPRSIAHRPQVPITRWPASMNWQSCLPPGMSARGLSGS